MISGCSSFSARCAVQHSHATCSRPLKPQNKAVQVRQTVPAAVPTCQLLLQKRLHSVAPNPAVHLVQPLRTPRNHRSSLRTQRQQGERTGFLGPDMLEGAARCRVCRSRAGNGCQTRCGISQQRYFGRRRRPNNVAKQCIALNTLGACSAYIGKHTSQCIHEW